MRHVDELIKEGSMNDLAEVCKVYESCCDEKLVPGCPIYARIDGRAFHTFTRGLEKPFDHDFMYAMKETAKFICKETKAALVYVQSDEISAFWLPSMNPLFDGRVNKLVSVLAGMASSKFAITCLTDLQATGSSLAGRCTSKTPHFDCRVCNLPTKEIVYAMFKWREMDAYRNAVNSVAQANFSSNQLHGKGISDVHEMLFSKGINFTKDFDLGERHGTFYGRRNHLVKIEQDILDKMPVDKRPENGMCVRTFIDDLKIDSFKSLQEEIERLFHRESDIPVAE